MEFHPSQLPVSHTFQVEDASKVSDIANQMVRLGFSSQKGAFRIIMTKEEKAARRIGFTLLNEINFGLRKAKQERDVRYWVYSYDTDHYAMVLISNKVMQELGF